MSETGAIKDVKLFWRAFSCMPILLKGRRVNNFIGKGLSFQEVLAACVVTAIGLFVWCMLFKQNFSTTWFAQRG